MPWNMPEYWEVAKYYIYFVDRVDLPITVGRNEVHLRLKQRDEDPVPVFVHIKFIRDGEDGGSSEEVGDTSRHLYMNVRENSFAPMIDVLRNEKPIYWFWQADMTPPWGSLNTDIGGEIPGEGEDKHLPFFKIPFRP